MNDNRQSEKRHNVRAIISTRGTISLVDKDKINLDMREQTQQPDDKFMNPSVSALSDFITMLEEKSDPQVSYFVECLSMLDEKLDKIINTLENGKDNPEIEIEDTKNISASGIGLISGTAFEKDQVIDISLNIPGFPLGKLKTYGRIIHSEPRKGSEKNLFDVGIQFLNLSEQEREGLVAYTFCQQRKIIRQLKEIDE